MGATITTNGVRAMAVKANAITGPATIAGATITTNGVGTVTVTASQAATADYAARTAITNFTVGQVAPTLTLASIAPQTAGQTLRVNAASSSPGAISYDLGTGSPATISGNIITLTGEGIVTVIARQSATADFAAPASTSTFFAVIAATQPTINTQPVSQTVCLHGSLRLTVTAKNAGGYQWYLDSVAVLGATSSDYNLSAALTSDAGNYTVVVSNEVGSVTSNSATIVVGATIASNPASLSVSAGQTATFAVAVTGDSPFTYQWYEISPSASTGTLIAGANESSYTTAQTTSSSNASKYYVAVTDACGTTQNSSAATLAVSVNKFPPTITTQPSSQTVSAGATPSFSATAVGSGTLTYQWYLVSSALNTTAVISGATSSSYDVPPSSTEANNDQDQYYVIVTNSYGHAASVKATLAVGVGIQITQQPKSLYTDLGESATLSVTATSILPLSYQWFEASPGSSVFTAIANATNATYTLPSINGSQSGSVFYVVVSNGSSSPVTSTSAAVFVGPSTSVPSCSTGWNTVGNAFLSTDSQHTPDSACGYQLTAATQYQAGQIVWPTIIATDNLQLRFTVTTSNASNPPADGFAVVLGDPSLGATLTSWGSFGEGLGAKGIPGLTLAFDDYENTGDPTVPYVGVTRGEFGLWENPYFLIDTAIPALAVPGQIVTHSYVVSLVAGKITVSMDGVQILAGAVSAPPAAYLYVTSGTGASWEQTQITNISVTASAP